MNIVEITDDLEKKSITQNILKALPEWFGIPESMEEYIQDSAGKPFFCARINKKNIGFLYLKQTGKDTMELAVMGVLKEYHRNGIGHALFEYAKKEICKKGYSFFRLKLFKWESMKAMTKRINFIYLLVLKSLRCFCPYGTNGIHVRYTLWHCKNIFYF